METKTYNVLWTGGFDSTYRIVSLSRKSVVIQPFYVVNEARESINEEKKAMKEILDILQNEDFVQAQILPIIYLQRKDYPPSHEIKSAYKIVKQKAKLGPQYEWLSAISYEVPDLELCLEKSRNKPTKYDLYIRNANYDHSGKDYDEILTLNQDNDPNLLTLFGNFSFPKEVFRRTKEDFLTDFKAWGLDEIVGKTWFCSMPIDGEPCGYCAPCRNVGRQGMLFRLPENSLRRYKHRALWLIRYKIIKTAKQINGSWQS